MSYTTKRMQTRILGHRVFVTAVTISGLTSYGVAAYATPADLSPIVSSAGLDLGEALSVVAATVAAREGVRV